MELPNNPVITLDDIFSMGLFERLQSVGAPWPEGFSDILESAYNSLWGERPASHVLKRIYKEESTMSHVTGRLASVIVPMYRAKWLKLYGIDQLTYNPIENYSMTESREHSETTTYGHTVSGQTSGSTQGTSSGTDALQHGKTDTVSSTVTESDQQNTTDALLHGKSTATSGQKSTSSTRTPAVTASDSSTIFGFDSGSTGVPLSAHTSTNSGTDSTTGTDTDTSTVTDSGTDTHTITATDAKTTTTAGSTASTGTDTRTVSDTSSGSSSGTSSETHGGHDDTEGEYTLTRSGNIGVTTSQQMIESEISLWQWSFYRNVVFPDLNTILASSVYCGG